MNVARSSYYYRAKARGGNREAPNREALVERLRAIKVAMPAAWPRNTPHQKSFGKMMYPTRCY